MKTIQIVCIGQQKEHFDQFLKNLEDVTIILKEDAEAVIEYANANLVDILITDVENKSMVKLQKILSILQEDIVLVSTDNRDVLQNVLAQKRALIEAAQQTKYNVSDDGLKQAMLPIQIQ